MKIAQMQRPNRVVDLTGRKFGKLTVVDIAYLKNRHIYWNCLCECGNTKIVNGIGLKRGTTKSCGCYNRECLSNRKIHGLSKRRIHNIWCGMKARCYNPHVQCFSHYGGRGIQVCDQWLHDSKAFIDWSMSHGYTDELSIDRTDVNGDYEPDNCRWASKGEQARNTTQNHFITINGLTKCFSDWAHDAGISVQTAIKRMYRGWTVEQALGLEKRSV
jgi:hypothetical protein